MNLTTENGWECIVAPGDCGAHMENLSSGITDYQLRIDDSRLQPVGKKPSSCRRGQGYEKLIRVTRCCPQQGRDSVLTMYHDYFLWANISREYWCTHASYTSFLGRGSGKRIVCAGEFHSHCTPSSLLAFHTWRGEQIWDHTTLRRVKVHYGYQNSKTLGFLVESLVS